MKFLEHVTKKPAVFQRTVGLTKEQFQKFVQQFAPVWEEAETLRKTRDNRQRSVGGGRSYKLLSMEHKLLVILLYYKAYITQEFIGLIVGLDQANISRLIKKLMVLVEKVADKELATYLMKAKEEYDKMPASQRINNWSGFFEKYPDLKDVNTDATEQRTYRSSDNETQKKYYSGKKKQHTLKTQISSSSTGRIVDVSESYPGSTHDAKVADRECTAQKFPEGTCQRYDLGFQGINSKNPDHYIVLPIKKPRGKELSQLAKELNKMHSKRRVRAEHAISRVKKFKICGQTYRGRVKNHNTVFRGVVAFVNFKWANPAPAK
jgi:DDE superfamily endonuclease